ncbi:MAG: hypothetical protein HY253_01290 [Burkholderiales bacterium]|nr:hypothetical protein [Burkholderiales bacterium]
MGVWGEGLYDDDEACDLRDTISLLSKMPGDGESILRLVLEQFERDDNLSEDGCPAFWMVVADQFAKRGISCERVVQLGLAAIDTGVDILDLEARGMDASGLAGRKKVHSKLKDRIANPKPPGSRKVPQSPPKCAVAVGQVYAFPTMNGQGMNAWFSSWEEAKFRPDGWGSLIILDAGRVFDWFPWAAYTPLVTDPSKEPDLDAVMKSKTLFSDGVAFFAPKASHMKKMGMKLLGCIDVSQSAVNELKKLSRQTPKSAVMCDWSICSGAFSRDDPALGKVAVYDLKARS